jgi:predicted HD superfamily hydrolase involved in NAD metabolism
MQAIARLAPRLEPNTLGNLKMGRPKKGRKTAHKRSIHKNSGFTLKTEAASIEAAADLHVDRDAVLAWLESNVPKARIQHILRVETYAAELAVHHDLDPVQAAQAGLLHDLAKYFSPVRLLEMAQTEQIPLDTVLNAEPRLLHADVSAIVARDIFEIKNSDILDAVRNHTLGQPQMNPLSCVVFLADSLEPGRGDRDDLNQIRKVSTTNLYKGVWMVCDRTLNQLVQNRKLIHPRMVMTRNWAMQAAKTKVSLVNARAIDIS